MEQLEPSANDNAELVKLAARLRELSPKRAFAPPRIDAILAVANHRSTTRTLHRRWAFATATLAAASILLILATRPDLDRSNSHTDDLASRAPATSAHDIVLVNPSAESVLFDLGPKVGRLLARPQSRFAYDPERRCVTLASGTVVLHIFPNNEGFRVVTAGVEVEVKGTLFSVAAESDAVVVWRGTVQKRRLGGGAPELIAGSGQHRDLTAQDLERLGVAVLGEGGADATRRAAARTEVRSRPIATGAEEGANEATDVERDLVLQAQAAVAEGRLADARRLLEEHRARFPDGVLAEEAELLLFRTCLMLSDAAAALHHGEEFLSKFAGSGSAADVAAMLRKVREGDLSGGR
ncbi:MAG: outer membrane protein assembly factor BamD [Deltaproteobacteria bacterium]|nr:outer membrane protein assembly factor BamD [Deltaproteobacteria bacterium]